MTRWSIGGLPRPCRARAAAGAEAQRVPPRIATPAAPLFLMKVWRVYAASCDMLPPLRCRTGGREPQIAPRATLVRPALESIDVLVNVGWQDVDGYVRSYESYCPGSTFSPASSLRRYSTKPHSGACTLRKRARPTLVNSCTTPGGTTTDVPGPARTTSPSTRSSSSPSST